MGSWANLLHTSFIIKSTYVCIDCISSTDAFGFPWSFQNFAQLPDWGEDLKCWRLSAPLNSRRKENKFPHNSPSKCTYYSLIRCNKIGRFLLLFVKSECFCTWYTIVVCSSIESLSLNVVIMFKAKVSLTWEKKSAFSFVGVEKSIVLWGGYLWAAAIHGHRRSRKIRYSCRLTKWRVLKWYVRKKPPVFFQQGNE